MNARTDNHQRDIDGMARALRHHGEIHKAKDEYTRQLERENSELMKRVKFLEEQL